MPVNVIGSIGKGKEAVEVPDLVVVANLAGGQPGQLLVQGALAPVLPQPEPPGLCHLERIEEEGL